MARTALQMTQDELRQYRPFSRHAPVDEERFRRAWEIARKAAQLLYQDFAARQVAVFGSLTQSQRFTHWSDIDLAVWGIPNEQFFKAAARVLDLDPEFRIDFTDAESCGVRLQRRIEQEGIIL